MGHKLRGGFHALPASRYLRDFLSPTLYSISILLGCTSLSLGRGKPNVCPNQTSADREEKKPRGWTALESHISLRSRTQQTVWNLDFQLTWQHSWPCLGHSSPTLSQGMISSVWALQRSVSGLLWRRCGENPNSWLSAGEPCLQCASLGSRQLRLHGSVVSLPFWLLEEPLRSSSSCWGMGPVTRRLSAVWEDWDYVGFHR